MICHKYEIISSFIKMWIRTNGVGETVKLSDIILSDFVNDKWFGYFFKTLFLDKRKQQ